MSTRSGASKGKDPAPTRDRSVSSDSEDQLELKAQVMALQQAQVEQALSAQATQDQINTLSASIQQVLDLLKNSPGTVLTSSTLGGPPVGNPLIDPLRASPTPSSSSFTPMSFEGYNPKYKAKGTEAPLFESNQATLQYPTWKLLIRDKLRIDRAQFASEQDVMAYMFGHTRGDAQKHLFPRYSGETNQAVYLTHQEMIATLDAIYINKFHVRESKTTYQNLKMDPTKPFQHFQTKFIQLANDGRIPLEDRFDDLYDKMTVTLQTTLLLHLDLLDNDFDRLCEKAIGIDTGIKRINNR